MKLEQTKKKLCDYCDDIAVVTIDGEHLCENHSAYCNISDRLFNVDDVTACKWCNQTFHNDHLDENVVCEHCRPTYYENQESEHPSLTARERN